VCGVDKKSGSLTLPDPQCVYKHSSRPQ